MITKETISAKERLNEKLQEAIQVHQDGKLDDAKLIYEELVFTLPIHIIFTNLGTIALQKQNYEEAVKNYNIAIAIDSSYAAPFCYRGNALQGLKCFEEALNSCNQAIAINSNYAAAYCNRGNILTNLKRFEEALISYDQSIKINPHFAEAYSNKGNTLKILKRFYEALHCYDTALQINANYAEAYYNKGNTLKELNRFEDAINCYNLVISINPYHADAYSNRGLVLMKLKRFEESLDSYNRALAINPKSANTYWNKAYLKILNGEYLEGWNLFEWRWKTDIFIDQLKNYSKPLWLGNYSLYEKKILIYPEQGLGDYIQFIRYAPLLNIPKIQVILEVPKSLITLISTLEGEFTLIEQGNELPDFDYCCPIMSLPFAFKTTLDNIPNKVPYFSIPKYKKELWQQRIGGKNIFRIGLVWSGSVTHENDQNRSIPLEVFQSCLDLPIDFHCLQKEIRDDDAILIELNKNINIHEELIHDFLDTAALIDEMNLIISVDTSVAHLAGALGKDVWILLPYFPDYRWLLDRNDSPWYPTAKLFRQASVGNWDSVINEVKQSINNILTKNEIN